MLTIKIPWFAGASAGNGGAMGGAGRRGYGDCGLAIGFWLLAIGA